MGIRPLREGIPISQEYGTNPGGYNPVGGHTGRDYAAFEGEKLVAIADGRVWFADHSYNLPGGPQGWAQRLFLDLTFGGVLVVIEYDDVYAIYAHLSRTDLNPGDWVRAGDLIGLSGNTGGASSGAHLHFEILPRYPNYASSTYGRVHPAPYITGAYRLNGAKTPAPRKTRNGIDVSAWQPADIASKVPSDFVIVKATEGTGYVNPQLGAQVAAAKRRGKLVGLYHFASAREASDAEAAHFLKHARPHLDAGAVAVLDWEPAGLSHYTQWAEDWLRRVDRETGKVTVAYMNLSVSGLSSWTAFGKTHPLWVAFYGNDGGFNGYATSFTPPATPGWTLAMWQYTQHGRLRGYAGDLDLNVYFGGIAQWDKATGAATITTTSIDPLEGLLDMDQKTFNAQKKIAGTPAWYLANGRDHSANLTNTVKALTALVKGIPASVLQAKVTRKGAGKGSTVTQAEALAYDKDNWSRDREAQQKIIEQNAQIIALLTEKKGA